MGFVSNQVVCDGLVDSVCPSGRKTSSATFHKSNNSLKKGARRGWAVMGPGWYACPSCYEMSKELREQMLDRGWM